MAMYTYVYVYALPSLPPSQELPPTDARTMSAQKGVTVKAAHTEGRVSLVFTPDGRCVIPL